MADQVVFAAELRTELGKGASRRLRREKDLVPAIIYGGGREAVPLTLKHKDLQRSLENEGVFSRIVTVTAGKESQQAILKSLQRHPAKDRILHVDFLRVREDQKIDVNVPIRFINEDRCVGVRTHGGAISHVMSEVEVSCLPGNLPEYLEVDMAELDVGESVHLREVVLPEGVEITVLVQNEEFDPLVCSVFIPKVEIEEVEEEEDFLDEEGVEEAPEESPDEDSDDSEEGSE